MSIRKMASSDLAVWMTRTELACEPSLLARYVALLSELERERWAAFRSEPARNDFLIGRALVRCALSHETGEPADGWRFTTNAFGKPELVAEQNPRGLRFNLSHTDGLIVCVVARGREVGVDVECIERPTPVVELARRFLATHEADDVARTAEPHRQARFFELWTAKESHAKALGTGLGVRLEDLDPARWQSWRLQPTPTHVLTVTAEMPAHEPAVLHLHHSVPLAA